MSRRSLIADLATVDTRGEWIVDDDFSKLASDALGEPLAPRDLVRAWRTPAGGSYGDDCEFALLRARVGYLVRDDAEGTPRYGYCVNVKRARRTLQSRCLCGSCDADYAKARWPAPRDRDLEPPYRPPVPSALKKDLSVGSKLVSGIRNLVEDYAVSIRTPTEARPIEQRPPGAEHKLACPLWAFRAFSLPPVQMSFLRGLTDKDGDPIRRELKDVPLQDRPQVDVFDESLYPAARDEDDILYSRDRGATTRAIEAKLKHTVGMKHINSGHEASTVNDRSGGLATSIDFFDAAGGGTRTFYRVDDPPPRTADQIMAEADVARATIGQRRERREALSVKTSLDAILDAPYAPAPRIGDLYVNSITSRPRPFSLVRCCDGPARWRSAGGPSFLRTRSCPACPCRP